jgi:hypothetical protein
MAGPITGVKYKSNVGSGSGIDAILKSNEMREFMQGTGEFGVSIATQFTKNPREIESETLAAMESKWTRWTTQVINRSPNALREEYGNGHNVPTAPLGHVINWFREHDPNRRKPLISRLMGR